MATFAQLTQEQQGAVEKARNRVIEAIGQNMDLYGMTQSTGHLYGLLFFSDHPMTLDEMGKEMEMSKTSMSTGVRTLVDMKMVHKVWGKGTRKDLYEVEPDWYQTFADYFGIKWRKAIEVNLSAIRRSKRELENLLAAHGEDETLRGIVQADIAKMQEAEQYYHWLDQLIDALESGEIFRFIPKPGTPE
ncbi:transcriptional regulator [Paenibacillus dendritiformis]|uniref:GbsR/MarR family transcriptional regulator n=1 Tax=Paenibacillus dendritiformis TaxID=130049 RepID=UPI0018CEAF0E|nr:GbsR/MarR family transcriptional regulator [Paenibacillus dendritiformis]MBG9795601.1 transcriptional regulator [Paenibacillus dendritiformis]